MNDLKIDKILDIKDDSILVLKTPNVFKNAEALKNIFAPLKEKYKNLILIVLQQEQDISVLDEVQMNKLGWVRGKLCGCSEGPKGPKGIDGVN